VFWYEGLLMFIVECELVYNDLECFQLNSYVDNISVDQFTKIVHVCMLKEKQNTAIFT
jgi:hypothetical protein